MADPASNVLVPQPPAVARPTTAPVKPQAATSIGNPLVPAPPPVVVPSIPTKPSSAKPDIDSMPVRWPPTSGRKRFQTGKNAPSATMVSNRFGKRTFPERMTADCESIVSARSKGEQLQMRDALKKAHMADRGGIQQSIFETGMEDEAQELDGDIEDQLEFLRDRGKGRHWKLPSAGEIPQAPYFWKPQPHKPVFEPSERLMKPARRGKKHKKKEAEPLKVNMEKTMARLIDDVERRKTKHENLVKKALKPKSEPKVMNKTQMERFVERSSDHAVATRQKKHNALMRKYVFKKPTALPSGEMPKKLTAEEAKSSGDRLYNMGRTKEKETLHKMQEKYLKNPVVPKKMTDEEIASSGKRLCYGEDE